MKKKILFSTIIIFLFGLFLNSNNISVIASSSYGVVELNQDQEVVYGQNFTVSLEFEDNSNINFTQLLFCQLSPNFICDSTPIRMNNISETYSGSYLVTKPINSTLGFHIQIIYINGSNVIIPDSANFLDTENIDEPYPGEFYFIAGIIKGEAESTDGFAIGLITISIITSVLILKRKRN